LQKKDYLCRQNTILPIDVTTNKFAAIAALLLALCAADATAQTTNEGKKVKQLRFDREKVTIVYNNGETEEATDNIVILNSATPVKEVVNSKSSDSESPATWYTIDGRRIVKSDSSNRNLPKGVYVKREGNRTRKTVVK